MLHIYRQVTGLRRYETFIVAKERTSAERFPFPDIEMVPRKPKKNFIRRFYLKHVRHLPALYYRGEMQGLMKRALGHRGFSLVEVMSPCPTHFGRRNEMPETVQSLHWLKEHAVPVERYRGLSPAEREGRFPIGTLVERDEPDFNTSYDRVRARAAEGRPA